MESVKNIVKSIDGVAGAATDGACGTTEIANKVQAVNNKSNDVLEEVLKAKQNMEKLRGEISRFKL